MKLWSRLVTAVLALAFALSVVASPAQAMSKKKKKEIKREERRERAERPHPISGANLNGRPGYFFGDTANTPEKGEIMGAAHIWFDSAFNGVSIPVGGAFGITDEIQVHASTGFYAAGALSGLNFLTFGGKYAFKHVAPGLDIAAGLDLAIGPLYVSGESSLDFDPYGIVTYTFEDGLQLNGQLGIMIIPARSDTITIDGFTETVNVGGGSYLQFNAGVAKPFDNDLTGIAELAINGQGDGATPLIVGLRTGHDVQLQAFGGLDLAGQVGVLIGGGVALFSK
jgi:hypothetical protein